MGSLNFNVNPQIDPKQAVQQSPVEPRPTTPTNRLAPALGLVNSKVLTGEVACLTRYEFYKRLQFQLYTGPDTAVGQPSWVTSDDTPAGKWRVYVHMSGNWHSSNNNADTEPSILYLIPPGIRPVNGATRDPFFLDYFDNSPLPPSGNNKGPLLRGLRVDQGFINTSQATWAQYGYEVPFTQDPIIVPEGWALLALQPSWSGTTDTHFHELRVAYVELDQTEELGFTI